eukprot:CAMPEP_0172168230 /NCGR_PEP_ID=MMETSP1050-20130122/10018_1 /TAXON_ID=233186 /ORGANISM="Cryptomonas curvata, Strain CCAP979/52" /LENGTH=144 /DNA_ID=CAMNT_0012839121 /DNA_START=398 /DNA_END=830 /DNA_ORIENTATION=-
MSVLRGDLHNGAVRNWAVPKGQNCSGELQYEEKKMPPFALTSTSQLSPAAAKLFCPGHSVNVSYLRYFDLRDVRRIAVGPDPAAEVLRHIPIRPGTAVFIFPPGLHDNMAVPGGLVDGYLAPLLSAARRVPATAAVVVGIHSMA